MSHPAYPTLLQRRTDRDADLVYVNHVSATDAYHRLVERFLSDFNRLYFPLGSPSKYYDEDDIRDFLKDSLVPKSEEWLEQAASDLAEKEAIP